MGGIKLLQVYKKASMYHAENLPWTVAELHHPVVTDVSLTDCNWGLLCVRLLSSNKKTGQTISMHIYISRSTLKSCFFSCTLCARK